MLDEVRKVGFVGLGRMGSRMAANVLDAGYDLTVYNRTASKMDPLLEKGAKGASSPREAAAGADVVISCLMDDQSVLDNVLGAEGLLAGLKRGGIHIGATTNSPRLAAHLARLHKEAGTHYLAGPVVGRPDAAATGNLLTWVSGAEEIVEQCRSLMQSYTTRVNYVGADYRVANTLKLCGNFMIIALIELMGEVYTFAKKSGIDEEQAAPLIKTILSHPVLDEYSQRLRTCDFDPAAFELRSGFKDVRLMLEASNDVGAPLNYASVIREKFVAAVAHDMEERDWSAIYEITKMNAGLQ